MDRVQAIKKNWVAYLLVIRSAECALSEIPSGTIFQKPAIEAAAISTAFEIFSLLIGLAVENFSRNSAAKIHIDAREIARESELLIPEFKKIKVANPCNYQDFDPAKLWKYLEKHYDTQETNDKALEKIALDLIRRFSLDVSRNKIQIKSGRTCFTKWITNDEWIKSYKKVDVMDTSSEIDIRDTLASLGTIYKHFGDYGALQDTVRLGEKWFSEYVITSREIFGIGDNGDRIITFKSKFEFQFSEDTASRLQVFLESYAPGSIKASVD